MPGEENTVNSSQDQPFSGQPPQISNDELSAFFQSHFSDSAVAQFHGDFLQPGDGNQDSYLEEDEEWYEEDDLGYYEDGVKRTLTDEQIAIFRHSEIQSLQREKDRAEAAKLKHKATDDLAEDDTPISENASPGQSSLPSSFRSNKKRKKKANRPKPEPKPDLRKRTWDVVDKGLDSLDYD